ncbi:aminotransferase class V-fold PLP-dependent enzyme [uncultured Paludibaculum sp.]|uniref:aminotransferase class V-fold PLP-dependent enzyme n=1 Tax=uncultured Paludibaculum sp. TaxID=1765020 RepID=UPI002AAAD2D4|nr:aminotransferase class V-fold PLP-dependent enzyme [uncultured Paludibaculum sp.]
MGYIDLGSQEICTQYRSEFPVTDNLVYLNHAAVAPLARRASDAMKWLADDGLHYGSLHYDKWLASYDGLRAATARLIHAEPAEIAIVKNTSEGIATVALGLDWKPGDKIVAFHEEFPANFYIWKKLEEWKGVRVEWLSYLDPLDKIEDAARGAKLLAISFVQYLSGYRADLEALGQICKRHGVFFFVDAIQGLGAFPLDVRKMNIQALAADGHKWLLGPEGNGVLYVQQDWQDRIEPVEFGWTTVAGFTDYASRDMSVRRDAGRYECGTLNTIGCFGLWKSTELILEVGIDRIAPQVQALGDQIANGARAKGYEVLGERTPATGAGIVSIRKPGVDARVTHAHLKSKGIITAPRQGWVRMSPHFYIAPADIDRMLGELPE